MTDWRDLPPIEAEEHDEAVRELVEGNERRGPLMPSQTFLAHRDRCHRSAYLLLKTGGGPGGHELNRGSIFHLVVESLTRELIDPDSPLYGENTVPPEVAKDRLNEVLGEHPELTVPADERDALRQMLYHWALGTYIQAEHVVGIEQMIELPIGKWVIRCKLDLVEQFAPSQIHVTDYKTQWNMPGSDEWASGGGGSFAGDFQTELYALALAFGQTPEGLVLGEGVEEFRLFLRFPRFLGEQGLFYREAVVTRQQLTDFQLDVQAMLDSLDHSLQTRKWQPTPGSHCERCPSPHECPLPRHLRAESQAAEIESIEDAERLGARWYFLQREATALKKVLRGYVEREGIELVRVGDDLALKLIPETKEVIASKPKLREAIEAAAKYGHGLTEQGDFDWAAHVQTTQGTKFDKRKVPKRHRKEGDQK